MVRSLLKPFDKRCASPASTGFDPMITLFHSNAAALSPSNRLLFGYHHSNTVMVGPRSRSFQLCIDELPMLDRVPTSFGIGSKRINFRVHINKKLIDCHRNENYAGGGIIQQTLTQDKIMRNKE